MAFDTRITSTRLTDADPAALLTALRIALGDATTGFCATSMTSYRVKKATTFSVADITTTQQTIDTAPALTPQRAAQNEIDNWPISLRAFALLVLDQINTIRAALPVPLSAITPAQLLNAIRNKAATLS